MSNRLLTVIAFAAGVAALSGCVVVPAYPGGYGYGYGYGRGGPSAAVVVRPGPDYRYYGAGYPRRW